MYNRLIYGDYLQEEIHELLLSFAEAGANVVRLKGGDPLVSVLLEMLEIQIRNELRCMFAHVLLCFFHDKT